MLSPEFRSSEAQLAAIAATQEGAFSSRQAFALGISQNQITYRVRSGRWIKQLPSTFSMAGSTQTLVQRIFLAHLWAGDDSIVCRGTAGWIWGFAAEPQDVDLVVPRRLRPPAPWVRVHRSALMDCDVTHTRSLPITDPTRTLIDLAGEVGEKQLEIALDTALRCRLTSLPRMRWRVGQLQKGQPGAAALKRILREQLPGGLSESALETLIGRLILQMRKRSFPIPERQFQLRLHDRNARLDFAFPAYHVGLEGDGRRWHGRAQWEDDLRRENAFRQAGWDVRRFSWSDATREPSYILDQAEAALRLAGWTPRGQLGF